MARRAIELTTAGDLARTPELVELDETSVTPLANAIPRADASGVIAVGWVSPLSRTIDVREVDGSPDLTVTTLVVANGDLENLGGGLARIRTASDASGGGGGSPLTVEEADGTPSVANVTRIVVGVGDLVNNGGGVVRLKTAADMSGGAGGDGVGGRLYLWANFI